MASKVARAFRRLLQPGRREESGLFDAGYYRSSYRDIASTGVDPQDHYMKHGWREGRNPSADFNTLFYRDAHLLGRSVNPLTHYEEVGRQAGLATAPVSGEAFALVQREVVAAFFDESFYQAQLARPVDDPISHYLAAGWRDALSPRADFDATRYGEQNAFVRTLGVSPFYHYASQRRMGRARTKGAERPSPVSRAETKALVASAFDAERYLRRNADVRKAKLDPLAHYVDHGWREGRDPHPLFNSRYYLQENADVAKSGVNPFFHFLKEGRAQGRRGNPIGTRLYPSPRAPASWEDVSPAADVASAEYVVVMPVYKGYDETLAAIRSVLGAPQAVPFALHVVNDVSPDAALATMLSGLAAKGLFSLATNERNLGFVKSVNRALETFADKEIVLLNSDVVVHGDWLDRLDRHAKADRSIATITPMSNNATICSYPDPTDNNLVEAELSAADLDDLAASCNAGRVSDIPTGVGFCFYMSRASREAVGLLDEIAFGRGYGEENDFCLRVAKAGYRNVMAEDVFVYHAGQVSFADFVDSEYEPGQKALHRKHPDYLQRVGRFLRADTGEFGRVRLDLRRIARDAGPRVMVFVTHGLGGGIGTHVARMQERLREDGVMVVHVRVGVGDRWGVTIASGSETAPYCPNLRPFAFNQIRPLLEEFLGWLRPLAVHVHSFVGFDWVATDGMIAMVRDLGVPYFMTLHDYSVVCHRNDLVLPGGRFCGLPDVSVCEACVASDRSYPEAVDPSVRRSTHAAFLRGAAGIFAPSEDIRARLLSAGVDVAITVRPHEEDVGGDKARVSRDASGPLTIVVLGAIGVHKGSDVLLNLARDARARVLPIRYEVIGYSDLADELAAVGVAETGAYEDDAEALDHLRRLAPSFILLPSIWPETFCYTLSTAFASGVPPIVFDIGAQRDRVVAAGVGHVLPYALIDDVAALNDRILGLDRATMIGDRWDTPTTYPKILSSYYGLEPARADASGQATEPTRSTS